MQFIELEGGYLAIAFFVLAVTAFVTTRNFMSQKSFKIGMLSVGAFFTIAILLHYFITIERMNEVKKAFQSGNNVICESKVIRKVAQSLTINKKLGWKLDGDIFVSNEYERGFHTARCIAE